jgi:16S rRNA (guanine966-N2)-methyltransferase
VVLDLFAGTGAFGLEALSRGAEYAAFADVERDAITVLQRNIQVCRFEEKTWFAQWDITKNLNCLRGFEPAFSLVFLDPPYNRNLILPSLTNLIASQCLEKGACIVVEHSPKEPILQNQPLIQLTDQRRYGKTLVSFFAYMV